MIVGTSQTSKLLWLLLLLSAPASAQRTDSTRVRILAGCWTTAVGKFTPATALRGWDSTLTNVPPGIRLDTLPGRGWDGEPRGWLLRTLPGDGGTRFRDGYFAPVGLDSVELDWTNGVVGLSIEGRETGDTISGIARAWTDYMAEERASITFRRTTCR